MSSSRRNMVSGGSFPPDYNVDIPCETLFSPVQLLQLDEDSDPQSVPSCTC